MSEASDIQAQRRALQKEISKISNPEKRAEAMQQHDEPLRAKLAAMHAHNTPEAQRARENARANERRWLERGSTQRR